MTNPIMARTIEHAAIFASLRCPKCGKPAGTWSARNGTATCRGCGEWQAQSARPADAAEISDLAASAREREVWRTLRLGDLRDKLAGRKPVSEP